MKCNCFLKEYIKNPKIVGAIAPSSEKLANEMLQQVDFSKASCIVEYGPGTGSFTEKILNKKKENTIFIAIEYNKEFYEILNNKFKNRKNFILINGSAENLKEYLNKYSIYEVDYIVSGLPFASLENSMSNRILEVTKDMLKSKGQFITFQYTLFKVKLFKIYFKRLHLKKVFMNMPPAYVLNLKN